MKMCPWAVLGRMSRPGRLREAPGTEKFGFRGPFCPKMSLQGAILGFTENRKLTQNRTFEHKPALGTSKNALREGVRKKHEKLMKKRCNNQCFLMAQNHVWRYTLRLFHTFAIFEKTSKNRCEKGPQKSCFLVQNRDLGVQGSIVTTFGDVLGDVEKSMIFEFAPGSPKNL